MGEHKAGSLGVRGSTPLSSTNLTNEACGRRYQRSTACRVAFSILIPCRKHSPPSATGDRLRAHAVAGSPERGVDGALSRRVRNGPMTIAELVDLGLGLVFALVTIAVGTLRGLWIRGGTRRSGRRGRR